jgi:SAM-dependent methyltransferase
MEKLNQTLFEVYKTSPYQIFANKTEFENGNYAVYGEVTQQSTDAIVSHFKEHFNENAVFYDLGCGLGKMVAHIALQYNIKKVCGVELSKERINGANYIKETYCKGINNISFIEGDFLKQNISDATVVYCDNTMYDNELTEKIIGVLPSNCLFICRRSIRNKALNIQSLEGNEFSTTYHKTTIYYFIKL